MLTDDNKAILILTTRLGDPKRPALTALQWHRLSLRLTDEGLSPVDLLRDVRHDWLQADEWSRLETLVKEGPAVMNAVDELRQRGIWAMSIGDDDYPSRLAQLAEHQPTVIFGVGDRSLLDAGGVGIVGSRDVSEEGAEVARQFAGKSCRLGVPVVSGAARGVDQLAMSAAYQAGGSVVGVLADSLIQRIRSSDTLTALDGGGTCLVTIQSPSTGFSAGAAMARNKLIYALSDVTVVVASAVDSGGTWTGATEALKRGYGQVAVWRGPGEGPGNERLESLGATAVRNVDGFVLPDLESAAEPSQLSLLDNP